MKDQILDLIQHVSDLGFIDTVKITGDTNETRIDGVATDVSVVLKGKFTAPIAEFVGTFGMPNLDKLKILLNLDAYKEDGSTLEMKMEDRMKTGNLEPSSLHFKNASGDFYNDYRLMSSLVTADQLKTAKFRGVSAWHVTVDPTVASIMKLKMQASANSDQKNFSVTTDKTDLKMSFGDHSTHAGSFIFQSHITGALKRTWHYPVKQFISILDTTGDKVLQFSDDGAVQITVNSGLAEYTYIILAQSK